MLHFAGNKCLCAQCQRTLPFIATSTGANGHTGDAFAAAHGANHCVQRTGYVGGQLGCGHGGRQIAGTQVAFAGNVGQPQPLGKHIVDAAGSAVQVGVGAEHTDAVLRQVQNQPTFIAAGKNLLHRRKHDGVMGENEVGTGGKRLLDNRRR